ncbi:MAG TPA: tRNA lysidine(34) synthetase TilS [Spirochaetia bacterium]|nr:tRNA lysidine(34) synthetase TilS [Spirochaetia bacterium]
MIDLESRVNRILADCAVSGGASIVVGVSGGPDSTALLRALVSINDRWGMTLRASIVDHGIRSRDEVLEDIAFVTSLCDTLGVPLTVARIPFGRCSERAKKESRSLEEVAREERHRLLMQTAVEVGAQWVALGHTQDDELETILMRFLQGSDVEGMAGIASVRGKLIRPLLRCSRAQILDYLRSLGQHWREDDTNRNLSFLRNRVRHVLVPLLSREFPGFRTGILSLSRKAGLVAQMLREQGHQMTWIRTPKGFSIPVTDYLAFAPAVRASQLMRMYDSLRGESAPRRLPWRFLQPALGSSLPSDAKRVLQGHGVQLLRRSGRLYWERCIVTPDKKSYFIEVSGTGTYSVPGVGVSINLARCGGKNSPVAGDISVLSRDIEWPLILRSRRKGDEILLERGATPLKALFAGWKVSEGHRQAVPVLADRRGVVAVLGHAFGYPNGTRSGALVSDDGDADRITVRASREHGRGT